MHFSPTYAYFLQPSPPPNFLHLFLSYAVQSVLFTPHTCTPIRAIQTFLPTCPQSLQVVHFLVTASWRNIAKYLGLENAPLECCNWRVQSDSDGAARSSPLSRKKKVCKHQSYAKRCIFNAQRHKAHPLIIAVSDCLAILPNCVIPYAKWQELGSER